MSTKTEILAAQRAWAAKRGIESDEKGYLLTYEGNLFQPMNPATKACFEQGSGSELSDSPRSPAKMRALHSSSALVVNVFDAWAGNDNAALLEALNVRGCTITSVRFEAQYPTGLPGNPPNLDVALHCSSGDVIGIESKFTEWLTPKSQSKAPFKDKYFPSGLGVWEAVGLNACQRLAERINGKGVVFRHLDAPQLLKHALGLATHLGERFKLFYTYFDAACPQGDVHRSEIEQFRDAVGDELRFVALSYQDMMLRFNQVGAGSAAYREYLQSRYFASGE